MKLTIQPVRQMKKKRTMVWVDCSEDKAQQYEIRFRGKLVRRISSRTEAERLVNVNKKPRKAVDRHRLVGRRWNDVKDKL